MRDSVDKVMTILYTELGLVDRVWGRPKIPETTCNMIQWYHGIISAACHLNLL